MTLNKKHSKNAAKRNPTKTLRVTHNATPTELCNAFETRLVIIMMELTQMARVEQRLLEYIQESDDQRHLYASREAHVIRTLTKSFRDTFEPNLQRIAVALETALRSHFHPLNLPSSTIATVVAKAQQRVTQACDDLRELIEIAAGHLDEEDQQLVFYDFFNFLESHGPGVHDPSCFICSDTIASEMASITHADGLCKNTFCRDCLLNWAMFCTTEEPTCPCCRAPLRKTKISHYLEPVQVQN